MLMVTDAGVLPPGPEQVKVYVALGGGEGITVSLPFSALEPLQAPEAVQEVACVLVQVKITL